MITYEFNRSTLVVTLDRRPVNAINREWIARFDGILDELAGRPGIVVVLVRSAQRVFCAGADLKLMRDCFEVEGEAGPAEMIETIRRMQRLYDRIEGLHQVTIAAVGGSAFGGGLELALACDLRVAAAEAQLGLPEARLGLLPGAGGTQRLSRLCGTGVARRLILAGEAVSGVEARELGLVQWAVPGTDLDAFAMRLAGQIAAMAPDALAACKQCLAVAAGSMQHGMAVEIHETIALLNNPQTRLRVRGFLQGKGS
ncbi:MAG TPA: enoyl-CoA hydratase/isomerase family protein [Rubrivivax sp.]|nr:enoyl-CoA hydratase/isomerase family protein [Rubrivivax sp.]